MPVSTVTVNLLYPEQTKDKFKTALNDEKLERAIIGYYTRVPEETNELTPAELAKKRRKNQAEGSRDHYYCARKNRDDKTWHEMDSLHGHKERDPADMMEARDMKICWFIVPES